MLVHGLPALTSRIAEIQEQLAALEPPGGVVAASEPGAPRFAAALAEARADTTATTTRRAPASRFDDLIRDTAAKYGMDPDLIHAVVQAESSYDPNCRSSAGATGLMQLMPGTARALGVRDSLDPAQNLDGGVRYLRQQVRRFGELDLALAAYNAGPGAVQTHNGVPPYRETQGYVKRVMQTLWQRKGE